jgi:ribosomal protein S6E (S10)
MGQEMEGEVLGENYKGYVFKLSGGNDKDGFPMKQGIMINGRTRMMFKTGRKFSQSAYLLILILNRCHHLHPKKNR